MRIFRFAGTLVIGAVTLLANGAASANAATTGVGAGGTIISGVTQVDMKPIPGTDANDTGLARPRDNISVMCGLFDNHGEMWDLSIDHTGHAGQYANTMGWIPNQYLNVPSLQGADFTDSNLCYNDTGNHLTNLVSGYVQADMKPIPGTDANDTGLDHAGDTLQVYCSLTDNHGLLWQLVLDQNGHAGQYADTVGFVPWVYTSDPTSALTC